MAPQGNTSLIQINIGPCRLGPRWRVVCRARGGESESSTYTGLLSDQSERRSQSLLVLQLLGTRNLSTNWNSYAVTASVNDGISASARDKLSFPFSSTLNMITHHRLLGWRRLRIGHHGTFANHYHPPCGKITKQK
jgi:hypothetical protein